VSQIVDREQRRTHEAEIIEHYHRGLLAHGLADYSLEQCCTDYHLGVLHLFAYAVLIAGTSCRSAFDGEVAWFAVA
jgi:hypothetical protein